MLTKIKYEKVICKGEKAIKILGWEGILAQKDLPLKYLDAEPCFYEHESWGSKVLSCYFPEDICFKALDGKTRVDRKTNSSWIRKGDIFEEEEFPKFISELKKSGNRLTEINKEIKETQEKWNGESEITI